MCALVTRGLALLTCCTIVAASEFRVAAAVAISQDVPVPGGTAGLAGALAIDPVPDRGRFVAEITRLAYDTDARNPTAVAFLNSLRLPPPRGKKMRLPFDDGTFELVPVPLTVELWSNAVFRRKVAPEELVTTILADRQAALICHGLAALDDDTLQFFAEHSSLVSRLYERSAPAFAVFSGGLRIQGNRVVPAGGVDAVPLWEAVVGDKVTRPERFVLALFDLNEGRLAYLYDIAGQLDPARRAFLLGSWIGDPAERLDRFRQLASAGISAFRDWHLRTLPYGRATHDLASALMRLEVGPNGVPSPPASRAWWSRVFAGADVPDEAAVPKLTTDQPIDAAWLAETIGGADVRQRGERLDQLAFAQRLFGALGDAEGPGSPGSNDAAFASPAFVAVRAVPNFRMLILALERAGVRSPAVYAAAARHANRLTILDGAKGFTAQAQFQGALALVARMAIVRTIDSLRAESLIERLAATSIGQDGRYAGAIARWLQDDVGPAIGTGSDVEAAVIKALGGAASAEPETPVHITWEGQEYRLDLGFAERRRLERVREKQGGLPIDVPMEIAAIARRLSRETVLLRDLDDVAALLTRLAADLPRRGRHDPAFGPPVSVAGVPELQEILRKAHEDLTRASRNKDARRAPRIAEPLVEAADDLLARVLLSFAYAMYVGDPDGTVLLAGDVSHRHDFGFGVKDGTLRTRAAWAAPRQDVAPGVPWHVNGSLVALDLALAPLALRRLNFDHLMHAPRLTSNERDTFAMSVALMNPYAMRDADRDAIADAIALGASRLAAAMKDPAAFDAVVDTIAIDAGRRRALQWTLAHEADRFPTMFTLSEQLFLGEPVLTDGADLHAWGMAALGTAGCLCTRMTPAGRWWVLTGRPQLGIVATAMPDLNLHVARRLKELQVPAALTRVVISAAMQDFLDEVQPIDDGDWLTLARASSVATREEVEDYLASATADGPLVPIAPRSQP
jgi:hypothetical protein